MTRTSFEIVFTVAVVMAIGLLWLKPAKRALSAQGLTIHMTDANGNPAR